MLWNVFHEARGVKHICVKLISRTDGSCYRSQRLQVTKCNWRFLDAADRSPECVVSALRWVLNVQQAFELFDLTHRFHHHHHRL